MTAWRLWIDAHVHIYSFHSINEILNHSIKFLASRTDENSNDVLLLCLTEAYGENSHARLLELVKGDAAPKGWSVCQVDNFLLRAQFETYVVYFLFSKQLLSTEGIELAVLGMTGENKSRKSIRTLIEMHAPKPMIIPWGFGKWIGSRGKTILDIINDKELNQWIWLGDSALRPIAWKQSVFFNIAHEQSVPVLSGSDSLPINGQERRIGKLGGLIHFNHEFNHESSQPFHSTKQVIDLIHQARNNVNSDTRKARRFGDNSGLFEALLLQLRLRIGR